MDDIALELQTTRALQHLSEADAIMAQVVRVSRRPEPRLYRQEEYFPALVRSLISQQLSVKAAATIQRRFEELLGGKVTSEAVLKLNENDFRAVGVSRQKAGYVHNLADYVHATGGLAQLEAMQDDEVLAELTQVKGIGKWTARMFLIFVLNRPDIFAPGDLAVRKAVQQLYFEGEKASLEEMEDAVRHWAPYRSYGCRLMWLYLDAGGI